MTATTTARLPRGTAVVDNTGRVGDVFDYGLNEDESLVYYMVDDRGEWKADAVDVRQVEP